MDRAESRVDAGLDLARAYWTRAVAPILDDRCPEVARSAARIGPGSEVLGLDDVVSRDHDWGLRLQVFVEDGDRDRVRSVLRDRLPRTFEGFPARMALTGRAETTSGVDVLHVTGFAQERLGFDPRRAPSSQEWLSVSGQAALEVTGGAVFEDGPGALTSLREALAWYPDDIWRYVVASGWRRLDQELPLVGRAADRGDDLGSRVITARLVDVATHLAFTLCRRWAPYPKWRGIVLTRLPGSGDLVERLARALAADDHRARTGALEDALTLLLDLQRDAGLPAVDHPCVPFWDRPYRRIDPGLVAALTTSIADPGVRALAPGLGSIDQRTDNVDVLVHPDRRLAAVRRQASDR